MPTGIYKRTEYHKRILADNSIFKKGNIPFNKGKKGWMNKGSFKKGHSKAINAFTFGEGKLNYGWKGGISYTKEYKKKYNQRSKLIRKKAGKLSVKVIQMVYEDNIKQYGTLTCYLCLEPINFGQDTLEHKIPLCRGGLNECSNLAIAHFHCNCKKHNKTESEYRNGLQKGAQCLCVK